MTATDSKLHFDDFAQAVRAQGFDEVLERTWPPGQVVGLHTHDFGVRAQVVRGDLWLTVAGQTRHLRAGDRFELEPGMPHAERYGDQGATYWVARRNPAR